MSGAGARRLSILHLGRAIQILDSSFGKTFKGLTDKMLNWQTGQTGHSAPPNPAMDSGIHRTHPAERADGFGNEFLYISLAGLCYDG